MTQSTTSPKLEKKTGLQKEREARDLAIYKEYHKLAADPGQSRTALRDYMMAKYNLRATGTLYSILKRVEARKKGGVA